MPVIVRSLLCVLVFRIAAPGADLEKVSAVLFELSSALQDSSAARFLHQVDRRRFSDYPVLESNVVALAAQNEIGSSVRVIEQTRNGDAYELKLDWLLQLRPSSGVGPARRRRDTVICRIEPSGKHWKVTSISPVAFFSPS